jgi:hypothetical protein
LSRGIIRSPGFCLFWICVIKEGIVVEGIMPGLASECQLLVKEENTAAHLGSGDVSALATPEMIRLMEKASVAAVDPLLPEGYTDGHGGQGSS